MDSKYSTAPELPGKHTAKQAEDGEKPAASGKIQLIESTKAKTVTPEPDDEYFVDDDDDELNEHVEQPGDPDGVIAQDKIREWQHEHPLPTAETKKRKPFWLKAFITLIIIAALAAGAWWFGNKKAEAPSPKPAAATQTRPTAKPAVTAENTKHYLSSNYTLEFDYPSSWTVADTPTKLTVTSPAMELTDSTGKKLQGNVIVTVQNQQTSIPGYPADGAVAALTSDKLSYKKPTGIQRAQTYVSYLGYKDNSLDAVFVSGDNGYQTGQQVQQSDIVQGNPLIGVSFMNCGTAGCSTGGSALSLQPNSWSKSSAAKDITALIESLQLD